MDKEDEDAEVRVEGGLEDGAADQHHVQQLRGDGHGSELCGTPGLPRLGDVCTCREEAGARGGAGSTQLDDSEGGFRAGGHEESRGCERIEHDSSGCQEASDQEGISQFPKEETWIRLRGENARQRIEELASDAFFTIGKIYVEEGEEVYEVEDVKDVSVEDRQLRSEHRKDAQNSYGGCGRRRGGDVTA